MINDFSLTKESKIDFKNFMEKHRHEKSDDHSVDMVVSVLNARLWPSLSSSALRLPPELAHGVEPIELMLTAYRASALMLFIDSETLSFSNIKTQLNLQENDLIGVLHSLSCSKYKILNKEPNSKNVSWKDIFKFKSDFTNTKQMIKVSLPPINHKEGITQNSHIHRCYAIDAAIVQIMKNRKEIRELDQRVRHNERYYRQRFFLILSNITFLRSHFALYEVGPSLFHRLVEECLKWEKDRVSHYLHSSSEQKLLKIVQHALLSIHAIQLLENEQSGCHALLRDDKVDDLSRMNRLFCRIPHGLDIVFRIFEEHVKVEVAALVKQVEDTASNKEDCIMEVIKLHDKYLAHVDACFQNQFLFHKANCDAIKGSEISHDIAFENTLEKVVKLLDYVADKDLFAESCRLKLSKKVLWSLSDCDFEKGFLAKLRRQHGHLVTSKMERMVPRPSADEKQEVTKLTKSESEIFD
ncbi:hypothetical protein J5N97_018145 [Dioscorea zingiberensis]|uniref:Cullin family profile domain-containing protein n=1 Tax=Dioscorea zingiberensis TaxID=325984 RepID=A0A9D5CQ52_9LILI|nr:hypothetical protein J5N97_018145 [Dioscorea zingiberensis]